MYLLNYLRVFFWCKEFEFCISKNISMKTVFFRRSSIYLNINFLRALTFDKKVNSFVLLCSVFFFYYFNVGLFIDILV